VLRRVLWVLALLGLVMACRKSIENKGQVRSDLMEYLSTKVGLDLKALDVEVTKVTFSSDEALATVSFHQKNDPSIGNGMVMNYTLQAKNGHWVVKSRADSSGHGIGNPSPDQQMPPGHPPVQDLPPGHPSVAPDSSNAPGGTAQGRAQ
jgi:hypothetical protein